MSIDPQREFVDESWKAFVDEAAAAAVAEPHVGQPERMWEQANPGGKTLLLGDYGLVLWNFAVNDTSLKREHVSAVGLFLERHRLRLLGGALLRIEGHASSTGAEVDNDRLSLDRAKMVAALVMMRGIPPDLVAMSAAGESRPVGGGGTSEALARDRRVELSVIVPVRPDPVEEDVPILPETGPLQSDPSRGGSTPYAGVAIRFVHKIGPVEFPSQLGVLMLEAEIHGRFDQGAPANIRFDLGGGQVKAAFEVWIYDQVRVVVAPLHGRSAVGFRYRDLELHVEFNPLDPRWPITFSGRIPPIIEPIEIAGWRIEILSGQLRGSFRPNDQIMRWLAALGARILARIAPWVAKATAYAPALAYAGAKVATPLAVALAYAGWILWGFKNMNEDYRRGREQGLFANARRGYARRIAYASQGLPVDDSATGGSGREEGRDATQLGWTIADTGWAELTRREREVIKKALSRQGPLNATNTVLEWIGGVRNAAPLPHPRELPPLAQGSMRLGIEPER